MNITVTPTPLSGTVTAPVSKSSLHRLMICAAISRKPTRILYSGALSEDIIATERCLTGLGAAVTYFDGGMTVTPFDRRTPASDCPLDCGESGSTLRFLIPVAAALGGVRRFKLRGRLPERPLSPLKEELCRHGAEISLDGDVLTVCGDKMSGGEFLIDGGVSSQFISGLLFALPLLRCGGYISVTGELQSRPYVDMTLAAMYNYGMNVVESRGTFRLSSAPVGHFDTVCAEGDWSGAAFWVFAGALSEKGIRITGLDPASLQGDRACVDIVRRMGAVVEEYPDGVFVRRGILRGIELDGGNIPDLIPVFAAVASAADGDTFIENVARLRLKESDRILSTCNMISAMGRLSVGGDDFINICGGDAGVSAPCTVQSENDHRIAMSAAILTSMSPVPVTVTHGECVKKSYPDFWRDLVSLGGQISEEP